MSVLRRPRSAALPGVVGTARFDRRSSNQPRQLDEGDVVILDTIDLDRGTAEDLVSCGVAAVVNVAPSISGRYPNIGPAIVLDAGIPLLDEVGPDIFHAVREGDRVRVDGDTVYLGERVVATGVAQTPTSIAELLEQARVGLAAQIESFSANTLDFLRRERDLLLDGVGIPDIQIALDGRHVVVVAAGIGSADELDGLRSYIDEYSPVIIGVDGGADIAREAGYQPAIIVGDLDAASDDALRDAAELIAHVPRSGLPRGLARAQDLGLTAGTFRSVGTSEDIALLLADEKGADLIVAVGMHATLLEYLDKSRIGMASSFLTRLRVGGKLVDAGSVARLHRRRLGLWPLVLLVVLTLGVLAAALIVSAPTHSDFTPLIDRWHSFTTWIQGLF